MIMETNEYRELLKVQLDLFQEAEKLAQMNKRYATKCSVLVVQGLQNSLKIICGNFASFRTSTYNEETGFHPEYTVLDLYSSEVDNLTFYVAKINIQNEPLPSKPCRRCMVEITNAFEVTSLVYRNDKLRIVEEVLR